MVQGNAIVVDAPEAFADNIAAVLLGGLDGVSCRVALTGAEALELADDQLDVAVMELRLHDGEGEDLLRGLRDRSPFLQVVIVGDASFDSVMRAIDGGAFGYVLKPYSPPALVDKVRQAMDHARCLRAKDARSHALERSEQRYRSAVDNVPAFVIALDSARRVQLWNRRLEEITGLKRDKMIGQSAAGVAGTFFEGDQRLAVEGGGYRLVRWNRTESPLAPGDPQLGTFAIGIDVTDERETQRRAARTERLVAVGTLAAGLAHEVRNPLNSASLQLQVLERRLARGDSAPEALQQVVGIVHNEIRRLDRLVNEFLAFARPSPLNLWKVSLDDILSSVLDLVRSECETGGIDVELCLDPRVGRILGDDERLRQVFLNIVRNAVEAMIDPGTLTVRTVADEENHLVRIDIEDTGPGFADSAPIFDAFYTTKENGTGLGLSIVHSIVTDHGGTIHVESQPGRTRFSVSLPQLDPAGPE